MLNRDSRTIQGQAVVFKRVKQFCVIISRFSYIGCIRLGELLYKHSFQTIDDEKNEKEKS